ncbi:MAG: hypothetical protein J6H20_10110, partial [Pyramidobacter sp.]|nr:hypothetical protein [Pyramidobacter sp.]
NMNCFTPSSRALRAASTARSRLTRMYSPSIAGSSETWAIPAVWTTVSYSCHGADLHPVSRRLTRRQS